MTFLASAGRQQLDVGQLQRAAARLRALEDVALQLADGFALEHSPGDAAAGLVLHVAGQRLSGRGPGMANSSSAAAAHEIAFIDCLLEGGSSYPAGWTWSNAGSFPLTDFRTVRRHKSENLECTRVARGVLPLNEECGGRAESELDMVSADEAAGGADYEHGVECTGAGHSRADGTEPPLRRDGTARVRPDLTLEALHDVMRELGRAPGRAGRILWLAA